MLNTHPTLTLLLALAIPLGGCGFFSDNDRGDCRDCQDEGEKRGGKHGGGREPCDVDPVTGEPITKDAGTTPELDAGGATNDSGAANPDAEVIIPDAGTATSTPPMCGSSVDCAAGEKCTAGACGPCADGQCACRRDDDCGGDDVCDHAAGVCSARPLTCAEVTDEAVCLARPDCQAVYGGVNCVDSQGGECTSSDPDCTCERFSFATCVIR